MNFDLAEAPPRHWQILTEFLTDDVNNYLDAGNQVMCIFIEYKKAFDILDHDVLLKAMEEYGIRGPTNNWFRDYLKK